MKVLWRSSEQTLSDRCHGASERATTHGSVFVPIKGGFIKHSVNGGLMVNSSFTEQQLPLQCLCLFSVTQTSTTANDLITSVLFSGATTTQKCFVLNAGVKKALHSTEESQEQ